MGAWHSTFADLMRSRFPALVAYGTLLTGARAAGCDLAERASTAVFARRVVPHTVAAAELAAREWMARDIAATDPARAALVLQAIDALDGDGVRRVLGKDAQPVDVTLEQIAALREEFATQSDVYCAPTGGVGRTMATARRSHRSAMARAGAFGALGVVAVGVLGYAAVGVLPGEMPAEGPTASASPSANPSLVAVTWNPGPDVDAAVAGYDWPECGETFAPAARSVGGVTPMPRYEGHRTEPDWGDWYEFGAGFESEDGARRGLLASGTSFVVTRNDVVVYTQAMPDASVDLFTSGMRNAAAMGIDRSSLCDAQEAWQAKYGNIDWDALTQEEQEALSLEMTAFREQLGAMEPGTYKVYLVTPLVFGEQAALAQQFALDGVDGLSTLEYNIAYTPLAADPRVAPYCSVAVGLDGSERTCDVPADVLSEVLTLDLDPATIVDVAPGMGISAPLEFEVE